MSADPADRGDESETAAGPSETVDNPSHYAVPVGTWDRTPAGCVQCALGILMMPIELGVSMEIISREPFQFLYVSALTKGFSSKSVATIAKLSRRENLRNAISGALLFDGQRFAQLLEGEEREVLPVVTRIRADLRHYSVTVLAFGHYGLPRLTDHWCLGRCGPSVLDEIHVQPLATNEVAIAMFMSALALSQVA